MSLICHIIIKQRNWQKELVVRKPFINDLRIIYNSVFHKQGTVLKIRLCLAMKLLKYLHETMILPKYPFLSKIKLPETSTSFWKEITLLKFPSSSNNNIIWNFVSVMQWNYENFCFYQTIWFFASVAARIYLISYDWLHELFMKPIIWDRSHELIKK